MMGLGWSVSQNLESEGMASEVPVVCLGQTSKTDSIIIIPSINSNNQPVPQPTGGAHNRKFFINEVGLN